MTTLIAAFAIIGLAMLGMSLGVIFSNRCIRGSCGGLSNLRDGSGKPLCEHCPSKQVEQSESDSCDIP